MSRNLINLAIQGHQKHQILYLTNINSKELYNIKLLGISLEPILQAYFKNVFSENVFEWNKTYILT